jgi:hypothetical protein
LIKGTIRRWLDRAATIPAVWSGYRTLYSLGQLIAKCLGFAYVSSTVARRAAEDAQLALQISPSLTVLAGPFRGYEIALFSARVAEALAQHTLLICSSKCTTMSMRTWGKN